MYLKRIESYGFKSFANKTNIEFELGMNVIVGPNGSGKSNIIDATRWVLGEQSAKALRGGNMQDVIFKGSSQKKQLGYAEVTLILDNADQQLPIEFAEVSVTRRLYRSGESLYLINNQKVRLQDVTNLFMDSGIGKESFSIIGQGRIDEILNSKPVDRRAIFEEAAGVLKYKTRKEQSLRRLERTHDNLNRVNDIISELEHQVGPLKKQAENATQYLAYKEELQTFEINLLVYEIKKLSTEYQDIAANMQTLTTEMAAKNIDIENHIQKLAEIEEQILVLDKDIAHLQEKLVQVTQEAENARGTRQLHQQKIEHLTTSVTELAADRKLLQEKLAKIETLERNSSKMDFAQKLAVIDQEIAQKRSALQKLLQEVEHKQQEKVRILGDQKAITSRYQTLKELEDSNQNLFQGVRAVIQAKKKGQLTGVEGTIVELIDVEEKFAKAIEVALGSALQNIITLTQTDAEKAVQYLKQQRLGRATFYPLDVLAKQQINTQNKPVKHQAVLGFADKLLTFAPKYENVFKQLLGQTLIMTTLAEANKFARETNFRYRIVTLDGEIVHRGGSITGGNNKNDRHGLLSQKKELQKLEKKIQGFELTLDKQNDVLAEVMQNSTALQTEIESTREERFKLEQQQQLFEQQLAQLALQKQEVNEQIDNLNQKENIYQIQLTEIESITTELSESYLEHDKSKEEIIAQINLTRTKRIDIDREKNEVVKMQKGDEALYKEAEKQLQKYELAQNTAEIKGNDRISRLQENYNCSYESVKERTLEVEYEVAEARAQTLRKNIDKMGIVNIGAIEEYERVAERYEYLTEQKDDLLNAENNLLAIINEMDDEMKERFSATFKVIQENFSYTFKKLFGGGNAELQLTDKTDVLESGIEIFAQPPGKKIQNLSLLSGGERALTAIALLFGILRTKRVPFCILDEVEAALDDANVERFAKYLRTFSRETQFIVVSHRKGTMEEADILYGVTMEEAGVSKILSVKLQDADKYIE